jgi:transposase-like protein
VTAGLLALSDERLAEVEALVRGGASLSAACRAVGIHRENIYRSPRGAAIRALLIARGHAMKAPPQRTGHRCPRARFCRPCDNRRRWEAGVYAHRRRPRIIPGEWLREHDARLRALAGALPVEAIAGTLSAEFGVPRSVFAVRKRAGQLGASVLLERSYTCADLARLFGSSARTIRTRLLESGLLRGTRRRSGEGLGVKPPHWHVTAADLEAFIRGCPWAYGWRRMPAGHPLKRLAEVVGRADPWMGRAEVARSLGVSVSSLGAWLSRVVIEERPRLVGEQSHTLVLRRRDVLAVAEARERGLAEANERRREGTLRRWRRVRGRVA